jgi:hypothetical protein
MSEEGGTMSTRSFAAALAIALGVPATFSALQAKPEAGKTGGSDNPVVCKREVPIGSLIATRKVCLTKSQWIERQTRGNEEARKQIEDNMARNPTPSG